MNPDFVIVDELPAGAADDGAGDGNETRLVARPKTARGKFAKRIARRQDQRRRVARRGSQWFLQNDGWSREEARRAIFGPTRKQASSHPTARALRAQRVGELAALRRWRRRQAVAAAIATAEASW